jgi:uncharacterized protein GlcG (DUF336 family)
VNVLAALTDVDGHTVVKSAFEPVLPDGELQAVHMMATMIARQAVNLVSVKDARALVLELERMDAVMPMTDPTAWRKLQANIAVHKRAAEAFCRFRTELQKIIDEETAAAREARR